MKPTEPPIETPTDVTPPVDLTAILPARSTGAEDILHYLQHHLPTYPFDP